MQYTWPLWGHIFDSGIVIASELELCRLYRILHQSRVAHIYMHSMYEECAALDIRLAMLTYPVCYNTYFRIVLLFDKPYLPLIQARTGAWSEGRRTVGIPSWSSPGTGPLVMTETETLWCVCKFWGEHDNHIFASVWPRNATKYVCLKFHWGAFYTKIS